MHDLYFYFFHNIHFYGSALNSSESIIFVKHRLTLILVALLLYCVVQKSWINRQNRRGWKIGSRKVYPKKKLTNEHLAVGLCIHIAVVIVRHVDLLPILNTPKRRTQYTNTLHYYYFLWSRLSTLCVKSQCTELL